MKIPNQLKKLKTAELVSGNRKGVALVLVLTVMSLATIMILAFFSLATSELRSSATYSDGLQAQQVAEQAVNLVIGQIRTATSSRLAAGGKLVPSTDLNGTTPILWASQPGAIRVWSENGDTVQTYKLYSDDELVVPFEAESSSSNLLTDFIDLKNWSTKTDQFVDLNEPVIRGKKVYYPIVDPGAQSSPRWSKAIGYDDDGIEGFQAWVASKYDDYNPSKKAGAVNRLSDVGAFAEKNEIHHIPMPVKWIYQLADGTLGYLNSNNKFNSFDAAKVSPDKDNQIVSRFAYWADDESAKINANTAAGGLAWDTPRIGGLLDRKMAEFQPARNEWQRYAGHPASTHLATVLVPGLLNIAEHPERGAINALFDVVPRVVGGGSESGSRGIQINNPKEKNGLIPDKFPLFTSVDDMIMQYDRKLVELPSQKGQIIKEPEEIADILERARFFMTVNSRAPETTPFGTPKVAMWPIFNADLKDPKYQSHLTEFDRLIHFCSAMGKSSGSYPRHEYIFKRQSADSATYDVKDIPRNWEILQYLDKLMTAQMPGYKQSFHQSLEGSQNSRQVLTQMFDYIRSANLCDDSLFKEWEDSYTEWNKNDADFIAYTNPRKIHYQGGTAIRAHESHKGHGQVTPIKISAWGTKGFGRYYSMKSAAVVGICAASADPTDKKTGAIEFQLDAGGISFYSLGGLTKPGVWDVDESKWFSNRASSEADGLDGTVQSNVPPMPVGIDWVEYGTPAPPGWPPFLTAIKQEIESGTAVDLAKSRAFLKMLFDPARWNWQLAYLEDGYDGVFGDRTKLKTNMYDPSKAGTGAGQSYFLAKGEKLCQSMLIFDMFCPSAGWTGINPDFSVDIEVTGLGFQDGTELKSKTFEWISAPRDGVAHSPREGGLLHYSYFLQGESGFYNVKRKGGKRSVRDTRATPLDKVTDNGYASYQDVEDAFDRYDLITKPYLIETSKKYKVAEGKVIFSVKTGGGGGAGISEMDPESSAGELIQAVTVDFPEINVDAPLLVPGQQGTQGIDPDTGLKFRGREELVPFTTWSLSSQPANPHTDARSMDEGNRVGRLGMADIHRHGGFGPHISLFDEKWDVVQQVGVGHGDMRIPAITFADAEVSELFVEHRDYNKVQTAHDLDLWNGWGQVPPEYRLVPGVNYGESSKPRPFLSQKSVDVQKLGDFDNGIGLREDGGFINKPDEGNIHSLASKGNGKQIWAGYYDDSTASRGRIPYFSEPWLQEPGGPAYFSPNRLISGPGMFGSLPRRPHIGNGVPWETLLFRPNVIGNGFASHPGAEESPGDLPDHVLMEFFWMPVVEPYAISEPLSTAGKININYQILPFRHIERSTGIRGVMKSEFMVCVPNSIAHSYKARYGFGRGWHAKRNPNGGEIRTKYLRAAIQEDQTLDQMQVKFDSGKIYKTASQFCEVHLVGEEVGKRMHLSKATYIDTYTPTLAQLENGQYWRDHAVVGDNSREKPYGNIHSRITTKSNTFKVHYRAQVVKQGRQLGRDYSTWDPELDSVSAEYRGSSIVERYVEPNDKNIPDYAAASNPLSLESLAAYHRFRVINPTRFAP